ncbi:hypothetical protein Bbelb_370570 [Branchiostoma belcheri]|nr:hypothetical protein Bbelb_370570 [Branchiostoma belcheri]
MIRANGSCLANPCDMKATCTNTPAPVPSATCTCKVGYTGDGFLTGTGCSEGFNSAIIQPNDLKFDVNACLAKPCEQKATCKDNPAPALDATCTCIGYEGDGRKTGSGCSDINACLANPCHPKATCTDTPHLPWMRLVSTEEMRCVDSRPDNCLHDIRASHTGMRCTCMASSTDL